MLFRSIEIGATADQAAESVFYAGSGVSNVKEALDELSDKIQKVDVINHTHDNSEVVNSLIHEGSGRVISESERVKLSHVEEGATADQSAREVPYANEEVRLSSVNVQDAISEVAEEVEGIKANGHIHQNGNILTEINSASFITQAERDKLGGIKAGATGDQTAQGVIYDPSVSGLNANNIQSAIDELIIGAAHSHNNLNTIMKLQDPGSGYVISDEERDKLETIAHGATCTESAKDIYYDDGTLHGYLENQGICVANLESAAHVHSNEAVLSGVLHEGSGRIISEQERNKLASIEDGASVSQSADGIPYRNGTVHRALDVLKACLDGLAPVTHKHDNLVVLKNLTGFGSGSVITGSERSKLDGIEKGATQDQDASEVPYNNEFSALSASTLQDAIDEIGSSINLATKKSHFHSNHDTLQLIRDTGSGRIMSEAERRKLAAIEPGAKQDQDASDVSFNVASIEAKTVQGAVEEINEKLIELTGTLHFHKNETALKELSIDDLLNKGDRDKLVSIEFGAKDDQDAREIPYDASSSGLEVSTVQEALDQLMEIIRVLSRQIESKDLA